MQPLQWTLPSHRLLPLHLMQPLSTINAPALATAMITVPLLPPLPLDLASRVTVVAAFANITSAVVVIVVIVIVIASNGGPPHQMCHHKLHPEFQSTWGLNHHGTPEKSKLCGLHS